LPLKSVRIIISHFITVIKMDFIKSCYYVDLKIFQFLGFNTLYLLILKELAIGF
jgi:hypothetical protein